jgi:histidinol-phosphate phosphatase family protein
MELASSRAVFLDRDGVINEEGVRSNSALNLRIFPGAANAIKRLNETGYRVVVVTNQAAVARGLTTADAVHKTHKEMKTMLAKEGATIDGFYFCPHHPEGTVKEYAIACGCRKPGTGMIASAAKDFDIDLAKSFLVGDKTGDILAGKRAGLTTILVRTGYGGADGLFDVTPDFVANNLSGAADYILS